MNYELTSAYKPTGDQPEAIAQLTEGVLQGVPAQTLLGVTGSGKTFTIANVIANINKPTLILSHNKTLAAQLYNSRLMSLSKTKATRRSPCYGEERLFLAFLGCWLGRLFRRSLLLVGTLVELGCNHDDSGVLHAILVCPLLWLEETLDGEQRALGELVE